MINDCTHFFAIGDKKEFAFHFEIVFFASNQRI